MNNLVRNNSFSTYLKTPVVLAAIALIMLLQSCDQLDSIFGKELTEEEIVAGLKDALNHGTDTAVTRLSAEDGYYGDLAVKILLPKEAQPIYEALNYLPGGLVDETILAVNRAAEDAADAATPIFIDAILNLSINDGKEILFGNDTAATHYLRVNTSNQLYSAFKPKIEQSLGKKLVFNLSAEEFYTRLINTYNDASLNGLLFDKITENSLSEYTTKRALNGLFLKISEEEKLIRKDPSHRVTEQLQKVFSELD
ncbi:MAG: DUF4197 domain-containing protein [Salibacteraceae bacterium]